MRAPKIMCTRCVIVAVDSGMPSRCGIWSSASGSSTMKPAPRNAPAIEPRPPMMTMNSNWKERSIENAAGSHAPRWMKAHSTPATPTMKELTANALSLAYIGRMPITAAATSMSRIAIHCRPMALRTRFLAISANTHTTVSTNRYLVTGDSIGTPNTSRRAMLTEPDDELLVNQPMRRKAQSVKNCAASVATARYRPLMRSDGMPNSTPITVADRPPSSIATISGMPSMRTMKL